MVRPQGLAGRETHRFKAAVSSFNARYAAAGSLVAAIIAAALAIWISAPISIAIGAAMAVAMLLVLDAHDIVRARFEVALNLSDRKDRPSGRNLLGASLARLGTVVLLSIEIGAAQLLLPYVSLRDAIAPHLPTWRVVKWLAIWRRSDSAVTDTVKAAVWGLLGVAVLFLPIKAQPQLLESAKRSVRIGGRC